MTLYGPRNLDVIDSEENDSIQSLESRQFGRVVGSFSSGGCCENGVDTAALLALLAGMIRMFVSTGCTSQIVSNLYYTV